MIKFLSLSILFVVSFLIFIYLYQRHLIYYPDRSTIKPNKYNAATMQEVILHTQDGLKLISWYHPSEQGKPTIVYFHGNAGHIGYRVPLIQPYLAQGLGVLLVEYRGYAHNPGTPTEQGLYLDGEAAMHFLHQQGIKNDCIILFGESLGTAVAIQIASTHKVAAVILQSPPSSAVTIGQQVYPYLPVKLLLRDQYDSLSKIAKVQSPILFIAARNDQVIPVENTSLLHAAAKTSKEFYVVSDPSLGHNNFVTAEFYQVVFDFLKKYMRQDGC